MKKLLLSAAIALTALSAFAELQDDGYYRVQNAFSKRYAYLLDDKGSFNMSTTSADVLALDLFLYFDNCKSDPSTIFYINKVDGAGVNAAYNIGSQGTSLYDFLGEYLRIMTTKEYDGQTAYYAYASKSGLTKYLGDKELDLSVERGYPSVDVKGDNRLWYIHPVDAHTADSYFGITPSVSAGGKYYYPLFAGFPFAPYSDGVKAYVVTKVNPYAKAVAIKEVTGYVPASVPVIVECTSPSASYNKLDIGKTGNQGDVTGNQLKGVYFNNSEVTHYNRKAYDKKTMRVLTEKNGVLTFSVGDYDYLPRNQAYLQLTDPAQYDVADYVVMYEDDYEKQYGAVEAIGVDATVDAYNIQGNLVKAGIQRNEVGMLGKGIYILRSGARMEKVVVP